MKKFGTIILVLTLLFGLCGCSQWESMFEYSDSVIDSLPEYNSEEFYTSGGFQDFTDYAEYSYDSVTVQDFEKSEYFSVTTEEDVKEIMLHIENFEEWVDIVGGELKANYDFDKNVVSEGDFFYIKTKDGEPIGEGTYGKFDSYTVYYFELDSQTLYYFHNKV
ncbi:MAG: hypothetical protein IJ025_06065 [Clostridia bacterium]|nr:hypothetical protein [Clostridia bacterium]